MAVDSSVRRARDKSVLVFWVSVQVRESEEKEEKIEPTNALNQNIMNCDTLFASAA